MATSGNRGIPLGHALWLNSGRRPLEPEADLPQIRPSTYSLAPARLAAHAAQLGWQDWEIAVRFGIQAAA